MKSKYYMIVQNFCDVIEMGDKDNDEFEGIEEVERWLRTDPMEPEHFSHGESYILVTKEQFDKINNHIGWRE